MMLIRSLCVACCLLSGLAYAAKGDRFPDEHKVFSSPESGVEVVQLTSDPAQDTHLYFTNNGFVPKDNGLLFASTRGGKWNLFYMNLASYEFVQLTDGRKIAGANAVVSPSRMEAFYRDGNQIRAVHLQTLADRLVTETPQGFGVSALSITADGQTLAFGLSEDIPLSTKTDKIYSEFDERFDKKPLSMLFTGKADGTGWHTVARQQKWISHTLVNPQNANEILYCHEGRWEKVEQRLWLVNSDDSNNRKLRPEETPELRIGHEFWFDDGIRVGYQSSLPGKEKKIGIANVRTGEFREYPLAYSDGHVYATQDEKRVVGDGSEKDPYLNLYELKDGKYTAQRLFRHGSSFAKQYWHPHPRFTPDEKSVLFTSNREGNGDMYLIRLP